MNLMSNLLHLILRILIFCFDWFLAGEMISGGHQSSVTKMVTEETTDTEIFLETPGIKLVRDVYCMKK